ncbi:RHS repeat-associated core domain-containing protein [Thermomonas sp. RSS23]|uniref:RHS repeat-associated core domain-containing protein n=1 Tax=Thermomonas beijingensis TaxID=2872701 RepID=A0ABS7TH94_9GAMM|nr:RHS repeat-associated core domain-containing protein [Thermomonas beijingensis]
MNNVYLAGSLLAEITRPIGSNAPTISYFHTDALGSPIAKTNAAGAIIETSEYEPYGRLLNRQNDDRAGYTGHVMDAVSGLTYMQQRYYDPGIGAFLSVDPVTAYSNPVGAFNRYRYASGNPYRFTDPDGRCADRYKDGSCRVIVDSATGDDGHKAGKQLEATLNRYDRAINKLGDDVRFTVVGINRMGSIGVLTGKEIKTIWNSQHVRIVPASAIPRNGGAGGFTSPGRTHFSPEAVSKYAALPSGVESLLFHDFSHLTQAGIDAEVGNVGATSGPGFIEREMKVHTIGSVMAKSVGAPFNCKTSRYGCY